MNSNIHILKCELSHVKSILTVFFKKKSFYICQKVIAKYLDKTKHLTKYLIIIGSLAQWAECSSMARETGFQSQVGSYQRLKKKKKVLDIPLCLTLSNIRYISRVKWSNPGKGVAPSVTPWCSSY